MNVNPFNLIMKLSTEKAKHVFIRLEPVKSQSAMKRLELATWTLHRLILKSNPVVLQFFQECFLYPLLAGLPSLFHPLLLFAH